MKQYMLILFDFDYTLVDSSEGIVKCIKYAFDKIGEKNPNDKEIKKLIGAPLEDVYMNLSDSPERKQYAKFKDYFMICSKKYMIDNVVIFNDTIDVLKEIKLRGMKIAIVSAKDSEMISKIANKYGFAEYIDIIIGEDKVNNQKPDPEPVESAIEKIGAKKGETLYIGDSLIDADTAEKACVDFLPVVTGVTTEDMFKNFHKIGVMYQLRDVFNYI